MLYICIYNETTKEIQYPEEWPTDTPESLDWARKNADRLVLECLARGDAAGWTPYASEEKQYAFD